MGTSKTTIELNGKRYDARTGKVIAEGLPAPVTAAAAPKPLTGGNMDGFTRRAPATKSKTSPSQAVQAKRAVQKSKTLMRPAVKKPAQIKNDIQAVKYVDKPNHVNHVRQARAAVAPQSPLISKFSAGTTPIIKKTADLHVVKAPATETIDKLAHKASDELARIEEALKSASDRAHHVEHEIIKKTPLLNRVGFRNKALNLGSMAASLVLLVGFFAYQNAPALEMRVAAARSGVDAQMPGYKPAGYAAKRGISVQPGKVSVNFKSRTDDKGFKLTQQASNWNSASLLANHVSKTRCNTCYQTWQNDGKTIYIYDNSNATWVNGGVWYQVEGNASLSSDQLLRLANSL